MMNGVGGTGEETPHARHHVHRHSAGTHDLTAQMHEARVVTHVSVGEKDAVDAGAIGHGCHPVQLMQLLGKVR